MFLRSVGNAMLMFLRCSDDNLSMLWSCSGDLLTMFWQWTHLVRACRPFLFLQIFGFSLLPFFLSSFLHFLLSSEPPHPQGGTTSPLTCLGKNRGVESVLKYAVTMCFLCFVFAVLRGGRESKFTKTSLKEQVFFLHYNSKCRGC